LAKEFYENSAQIAENNQKAVFESLANRVRKGENPRMFPVTDLDSIDQAQQEKLFRYYDYLKDSKKAKKEPIVTDNKKYIEFLGLVKDPNKLKKMTESDLVLDYMSYFDEGDASWARNQWVSANEDTPVKHSSIITAADVPQQTWQGNQRYIEEPEFVEYVRLVNRLVMIEEDTQGKKLTIPEIQEIADKTYMETQFTGSVDIISTQETPQSVKDDYRAGRITREEALTKLRSMGIK